MKRKYLDDIGLTCRHDTWCENDPRQERWEKQRAEYGFDERETWGLDMAFYEWLYERLMMYVEIGGEVVNLDYHKFEYRGEEYTQRQMIDMMLERLRFCLSEEYDDTDASSNQYVSEIEQIWAVVLPAMWW